VGVQDCTLEGFAVPFEAGDEERDGQLVLAAQPDRKGFGDIARCARAP